MAAAVRPPDRLRLEFFGPVGGVRLLLSTDGSEAHAVFPRQRLYDHAPATPRALARLTGLRFEPAGLVALLQGQLPCAASDAGPAPAGPADGDRPLRCRLDEAVVELRVGDTPWARSITISLEMLRKSIHLDLVEGPTEADLADDLFSPAVPKGYARGNLLGEGQPLLIVDEPARADGSQP
jgi:hypothetical protein